MRILAIVLMSVLFILPAYAELATWNIDPKHTSANFSIRHMMISNVRGSFDNITGTVLFDSKNLQTAKVDATIDVRTINTHEPKRDDHLLGPDFFDVTKYPAIVFKSRRVAPMGIGRFMLTGDLTMHGITKEVTLEVDGPTQEIKDPYGNTRIGASATTKLNRKDFGITWNGLMDTGGAVLGDEVKIEIEVELLKLKHP